MVFSWKLEQFKTTWKWRAVLKLMLSVPVTSRMKEELYCSFVPTVSSSF